MFPILIVILILAVLFYGSKFFAQANPAMLARLVRRGGGVVSLLGAGLLLVRGQVEVALGLGGLGLYLLGFSGVPHWSGMFGGTVKPGRVSRVRSAVIEMELDHDSGSMRGMVLAGSFGGRQLDELTRPQCEELFTLCQRDDPEGARLLEAYLDRRFAGRRAAGEGDRDAGSGDRVRRGPGMMSEDEAYEVLGLAKGAAREDVTNAHRSLMKKLHPDHGGTTSLAARVNEAKDVLMRRHG